VAREQVKDLIGAFSPSEIIFTGCATESINHALKGVLVPLALRALRGDAKAAQPPHVIVSSIEHPAVVAVVNHLRDVYGVEVTVVGVDSNAMVDQRALEAALQPNTAIVSIMLANNEVGTINPIAELREIVKTYNQQIVFHTDASQACGKMHVDVEALGVDMLTIAGHKMYGPKGVGALYVRAQAAEENELVAKMLPLSVGAPQEQNRRSGTENVALIVGFGRACAVVRRHGRQLYAHAQEMRDLLHERLVELAHGVEGLTLHFNGHRTQRLTNTCSVSFQGVAANDIIARVEKKVALSAGAACHSGKVKTSAVLGAMRIPQSIAMGTLRLSVGKFTTADDVTSAAAIIVTAARGLITHPPAPAADGRVAA
jgi:cysteine desulfurase